MPSVIKFDVEWRTVDDGLQCLAESAVDEQRRVDAVRQFAQLSNRLLDRLAEFVEHLRGHLGIFGDDVFRQAKIDRQGDEVLLRTVVQIALDASTFGVTTRDDARSRGAQFVGLAAKFVERALQRRVELRVVQR